MNQFGTYFQLSIFGESHGPAVGITIDGCTPGISLSQTDFEEALERRRGGKPGTTRRVETDVPEFLSGLFNGYTTGAPLTIIFRNTDVKSADYEQQKNIPRPGHADFIAGKKYKGFQDFRGGGHFSGRLTVCLVAAGMIAKKMVNHFFKDIECTAYVKEAGGLEDINAALQKAIELNDSIGGIVECTCRNVPAGTGEPFFNSIESVLAHALFSIPAIKGVEFGSGFEAARMTGSLHNDPIINKDGKTSTNNAGGISGGLANGNDILFRVAVKPASSTPQQQKSLNVATDKIEKFSVSGRHDLAIVLRVPVVVEAVTWLVLADMISAK